MSRRERKTFNVTPYVLLAVALSTATARAAGQEFGRLDTIVDGMDVLSNVATLQGNPVRFFLLERETGKVWIIENGRLLEDPFLDIGDRVLEEPSMEEGLIGLAFPPDFAREPRVYLTYIDRNRKLVLSGFPVDEDADQAIASSERILFRLDRATRMHLCGHITFGPKDGALYVCIGDDQNNRSMDAVSQNLETWKGKLLRIPLDVLAADDGPTDSGSDALERLNPQIVGYGLRNPWHFTFDPHTGDLLIPDVGRYDAEEINFMAHGADRANFGWPFAEGNHCHGSRMLLDRPSIVVATGTCEGMKLSWPILEYGHHAGDCAVIGGEVYRGERRPEWDGVFVFGDMCSGKVWALRHPEQEPSLRLIFEGAITPHVVGKDGAGEIVIVDGAGAVYRLSFPEDFERGWRSVDEVMSEMMLSQRREGTGPAKRMLDLVLKSETWQWGKRLARWYRTVAGWFQ